MAQALPPPDPPALEIIVTGRALPDPASEAGYSVDLISRERLERSPSHELDQVLKEIPGLQLFRRSDARSGHPTSHGVTLRALGGTASSRALLILDGVPQSDPFGGWVNWPAYDPASLERVRIVHGGGSVANGSGALAGTIEMTSRSDPAGYAETAAGSRDSLEARGRGGVGVGSAVLGVNARYARGDGFIPISDDTRGTADRAAPYKSWSGRTRLVAPIGDDVEIQANASGFHDWRTRGVEFTENRTNGADASLRLVGRGRWQWSALGYWQWRNLRSSFASVSDGRESAARVSLQDSVPSHGLGGAVELRPPVGDDVELRLGLDARRTSGESRELFSYVAGEPTRRRRAGGRSWSAGAFAEITSRVDPVTLTGGVRLDRWRITDGHLFEQVLASGAILRDDQNPVRSGWQPTARIGAQAALSAAASLRAAAYLGWRLPTLNELFRPFRAGSDATAANPELDPERLTGIEAGLDYRAGDFRASATGFLNRLADPIANVTLAQGPGSFPGVGFVGADGQYRQRRNLEAINVRGVEVATEWARGPWSMRVGASLIDAKVEAGREARALDGLRPAQTPQFAATLTGGWADQAKSIVFTIRHVGRQYEDDLNSRVLKSATTVDAFASWPILNRVQLIARAENVFDALVPAAINGDGSVERATPRTIWIGLRLGR